MSLKLTNRPTPKQWEILKKLGYIGKQDITSTEAATLIDELFIERRLNYGEISDIAKGYYDIPENQLDDKYNDGSKRIE